MLSSHLDRAAQRDFLWKYQLRIQGDSLYTYDAEHGHTPEAIHSYGQVGLSLSLRSSSHP